MKDVLWTTAVVLCFAGAVIRWSSSENPDFFDAPARAYTSPKALNEAIQPIPLRADVDPKVSLLGERLFHEPRLSGEGTRSCATCHDLGHAGIDRDAEGRELLGIDLPINVPTVLNASLNFRQFWDGRAETLEEQVDGPLLNPLEMNSSWEAVIEFLESDPEYAQAFRDVYGSAPSPELVRSAIATFERTLLTPNSRFDQYLRGDPYALSPAERNGYALFKDYGCVGCHQGQGVGGNMFQRLGIVRNYFEDRGGLTEADLGRFNQTGEEADRHVFKVPSLRNVALTAPYFHDGSAQTLGEAIRTMARYQLGREIPHDEIAQIESFLHALTGETGAGS